MRLIGAIGAMLSGMVGFLLCLGVLGQHLGFWGWVVAFLILPVTLAAAPWYAGFVDGDWLPLFVLYGCTIAFGFVYRVFGGGD